MSSLGAAPHRDGSGPPPVSPASPTCSGGPFLGNWNRPTTCCCSRGRRVRHPAVMRCESACHPHRVRVDPFVPAGQPGCCAPPCPTLVDLWHICGTPWPTVWHICGTNLRVWIRL